MTTERAGRDARECQGPLECRECRETKASKGLRDKEDSQVHQAVWALQVSLVLPVQLDYLDCMERGACLALKE